MYLNPIFNKQSLLKYEAMITFQSVLKAETKLKTIPSETQSDFYYKEMERFNQLLRDFIRNTDFSTLSGKKVLKLCSLVSTYRPIEPFSFLIRCAQLIES